MTTSVALSRLVESVILKTLSLPSPQMYISLKAASPEVGVGWSLIRNWNPIGTLANSTWRLVQRSGTL